MFLHAVPDKCRTLARDTRDELTVESPHASQPEALSNNAQPPLRRVGRRAVRWVVVLALVLIVLRLTGCMERLFYIPTSGPTPPPNHPPNVQRVYFDSRDGTQLCAWFIPARQRMVFHQDNQNDQHARLSPTILHVHGNAGNVESHEFFTAHLPPAGFNVFLFDYRGYGESEGAARRREALLEDTHAALDYLLTRDDVDATRIGMYGQSLGGSIGLNVMAERDEIRCAVIESAFASWRDIVANAIGGDPPFFLARWLAALLIRDDLRPVDAIARIGRPILILHGTADSIIPISHGRRLAKAGGASTELIELPGGDHNVLRQTHPEVDQMMIDFFHEHVDGDVEDRSRPTGSDSPGQPATGANQP